MKYTTGGESWVANITWSQDSPRAVCFHTTKWQCSALSVLLYFTLKDVLTSVLLWSLMLCQHILLNKQNLMVFFDKNSYVNSVTVL